MEDTADLENSSDELVATPDDEVKQNSDMYSVCVCLYWRHINLS